MEREDLFFDGQRDADNPEEAIKEGLLLLAGKWSLFKAERGLERWRFAVGAYNGGERDIIRAQEILKGRGMPTDQWIGIAMVLPELKSPENARENVTYVRDVFATYERYLATPNLYA
jgi:membrane-bound lytic murein transglycosylase MltF